MTPDELVGRAGILLAGLLGSSQLLGLTPRWQTAATKLLVASFWLAIALPILVGFDVLRDIACPDSDPEWTLLPTAAALGLTVALTALALLRIRCTARGWRDVAGFVGDRSILSGVGTLVAIWAAATFSVRGYHGVVLPAGLVTFAMTVRWQRLGHETSWIETFRRLALAQLCALFAILAVESIPLRPVDQRGMPLINHYLLISVVSSISFMVFARILPTRATRPLFDLPLLLGLGYLWLLGVRHALISGGLVTLGQVAAHRLWDLVGPNDPRMFYWESGWAMLFSLPGVGLFASHVASRLGRTAGLTTFEIGAGLAVLGWSYRFVGLLLLSWLVIAELAAPESATKAKRRMVLAIAFIVVVFLPMDVTLQMGTGPARLVPTGVVHYTPVEDAAREGWVVVGSVPTFYNNPPWAWIW